MSGLKTSWKWEVKGSTVKRSNGIHKGKFLEDQVVHGTYANATY